jgi:hypothetical protein
VPSPAPSLPVSGGEARQEDLLELTQGLLYGFAFSGEAAGWDEWRFPVRVFGWIVAAGW